LSEQEIIDRAIWTCDKVIVRYLAREKASASSKDLPIAVIRQLLMNKFSNRFDCAQWILEQENAAQQQPAA
jgi:hypothetical protein